MKVTKSEEKKKEKKLEGEELTRELKKKRDRAISIASTIDNEFRNTFSQIEWEKKFGKGLSNPAETFATIISFLRLHELVRSEEKNGSLRYRITLDVKSKLNAKKQELEYLQKSKIDLEEGIELVKREIKELESEK